MNVNKLFLSRKTGKTKKKSSETFEEKLARSDPGFLEFLKGEKSDLLAFDDGELSADSDVEEKINISVKENGIKKKKKSQVIQLIFQYHLLIHFFQRC